MSKKAASQNVITLPPLLLPKRSGIGLSFTTNGNPNQTEGKEMDLSGLAKVGFVQAIVCVIIGVALFCFPGVFEVLYGKLDATTAGFPRMVGGLLAFGGLGALLFSTEDKPDGTKPDRSREDGPVNPK
jgi:hypothetical protein